VNREQARDPEVHRYRSKEYQQVQNGCAGEVDIDRIAPSQVTPTEHNEEKNIPQNTDPEYNWWKDDISEVKQVVNDINVINRTAEM